MKKIKKVLNCMLCVMLFAFTAGTVLTSCPGNGKAINQNETITQSPNTPVPPEKPITPDVKEKIDAGIKALGSKDYDTALTKFEEAYNAAPNNDTKVYYALTQLAKISVKAETVDFMKNKLGFVKYPNTLKGLIDYKSWFKEHSYKGQGPNGEEFSWSVMFPEIKTAGWFENMDPALQIPAALIENSSGNFDKMLDDTYAIIFGKEFDAAWAVINSLKDDEITINKDFLKALGLEADNEIKVQKKQLQGIIGGLRVTRGAVNFLRSYKLSTDVSPFKFNWESRDKNEILKNLLPYTKEKDPFSNGFFTIRDRSKMDAAKKDIAAGADLIIAAYDSLITSGTLPAEVKEKVKEYTPIRDMVKKISDAIKSGSTVDLTAEMDKVLAKPQAVPGAPPPPQLDITKFEINMGTLFTPGAIKLSNLFEMNGTKPKIGTTKDGTNTPCFILTLKKFAKDFVAIEVDNDDIFKQSETIEIPLPGVYGEKIKEFYK